MNEIRRLRLLAGLTQTELAALAETSQPAVAAYESGRKSPTLKTLKRIARAVGRESSVSFIPPLMREDRRSLMLHTEIAEHLRKNPEAVLDLARKNIARMRKVNPNAEALLSDWSRILQLPTTEIVEIMTDEGTHARELRHVTPFAGVLSARERSEVYRLFQSHEAQHA